MFSIDGLEYSETSESISATVTTPSGIFNISIDDQFVHK